MKIPGVISVRLAQRLGPPGNSDIGESHDHRVIQTFQTH